MNRTIAWAALVLCAAGPGPRAQDAPPSGGARAVFDRDIRPIFAERCIACHGGIRQKGGVSLRSRKGALAPAESGHAALVPGRPGESELFRRVTNPSEDDRMPPKGPRLPPDEIEKLRRWIAQGAEWPDNWAFVPVAPCSPPQVDRAAWARQPLDRFILARLEKKGLAPSPEADRPTLLRRVSFDLTGLPPSPAEIERFLADAAPEAYEKMVDRALASPAHGERWGQHWLDAAGYADSNGYWDADSDRPLAWRYRDWVIDAVNRDMPFDEFVRWQLAGDEIAGVRPDGDVTPDMVPMLVATHFLRNAPDGTGESDGNPDERQRDRFRVIEAQLQNAATALLGLPVLCARCHDHPFEPVTQVEYYGLQAVLTGAYAPDPKRWLNPNARVLVAATRAEIEARKKAAKPVEDEIKSIEEAIKAAARRRVDDRVATLSDEDQAQVREILGLPEAKRSAEQKTSLSALRIPPKADPDELAKGDAVYAAELKRERERLEETKKRLPPELPRVAALTETRRDPPPHSLKKRGVYTDPLQEVPPGVPAALAGPGYEFAIAPPEGSVSSGRRSAFARWVTSPRNPLFARTLVNRVWQHHFGTGLAATADNLGESGERPSHPELLDHLADGFVKERWSMKSLHRRIVTSATYRQASAPRAEALAADPENRLLWRHAIRRLDAEAIRDSALAVAGTLDLKGGGPYVPGTGPGGAVTIDEKKPGALRRSIYLQRRRTRMPALLAVFDAPSVEINCTCRNESTVPLQSLALLNSEFALARAREFAARVRREAPEEERVRHAFLLALGRPPEALKDAEAFLAEQTRIHGGSTDRAWADFCQAILASSPFLYVE